MERFFHNRQIKKLQRKYSDKGSQKIMSDYELASSNLTMFYAFRVADNREELNYLNEVIKSVDESIPRRIERTLNVLIAAIFPI